MVNRKMFQRIVIFLSVVFIVIIAQTCCPSSPAGLSNKKSINILIPIPYLATFSESSDLGSRLGNSGNRLGSWRSGLDGFRSPSYFGYFTRYVGRASANGICLIGVNINGKCWYDSIGNNKW